MTDAQARTLIDRYTKAFLAHDVDGWTACYTADIDFRDHGTGWRGIGPEAVKEYWQGLVEVTSDLETVIHTLVVAPEGFAYNWTLTARLQQAFGPLPGDGRRLDIQGTTIGTFHDDRIDTNYDYWNWAAVMRQFDVTTLDDEVAA